MTNHFRGQETFHSLDIDEGQARMYEDAYRAITDTPGGWKLMKDVTPPVGEGFLFWNDKPQTMKDIDTNLVKTPTGNSHSGSSYGITMREMQYIAQHGWDEYKMIVKKNYKKEVLNHLASH